MFKKIKIGNLKKLFCRIDLIAIASLVVAILSLIVAINTDIFKKPFMFFNEVPVTFLFNNEYYGTYDLYLEEVDNDISFSEQLPLTVNVTNPLSNDIQLTKIYIDIENIERDNNPYFRIYANTKDDGVYVNIHNCGWGKAEKVDFVFSCFDNNVFEYLNKNLVNIYVDSIDAGETIEYPLILNSDVKHTELDSRFNFSVTCNINGINMLKSIKSAFLDFTIYDGSIAVTEVGGDSDFIYGIKFETNKSSFVYERRILEEIEKESTTIIPICVYPDQSCTFDLDIKFQYLYNGKEKYIHCREKGLKIDVDSSQVNEYKKDINDIGFSDIEETISNWPGQVILSYPAIDNCVPYPRCPSCGNVLRYEMSYLNILSGYKFNKIWYCENCNNRF